MPETKTPEVSRDFLGRRDNAYQIDKKGFTLIELAVVVAVLGVLMIGSYPSILNVLETRALENSIKDIEMSCQTARYLAVSSKSNHRVLFLNSGRRWIYWIERQKDDGTWSRPTKSVPRDIPAKFSATIDLPAGPCVEYSPIGYISNFDALHHQISLRSATLGDHGQPDIRRLVFYTGGSVQYLKSQST